MVKIVANRANEQKEQVQFVKVLCVVDFVPNDASAVQNVESVCKVVENHFVIVGCNIGDEVPQAIVLI